MGRVEWSEIEASGILTPQKKESSISAFCDYSINPYVGCAFGCSYCYVREMQYGDDAEEKAAEWGNWVKAKANAVSLLQRSLKRLYGKHVMIGSATDPYQPLERKLGLTRALLETLVMGYPGRVHIQTRSPLVTRDLDVFMRFGDALSVGVSIPTDDDEVRKVFEPSAPSIPQRIAAMGKLHEAGIRVSASFAPLLPCDPERLAALTKGKARSFWVGSMRYHWTDEQMASRYLRHHWNGWIRPPTDQVREIIRRVWDEPMDTHH